MIRLVSRLSPAVATLFLLAIIATLIYWLVQSAPTVWYLDTLQLSPKQQKSYVLGYKELGQYKGYSSADEQHLNARYDDKQGWLLSNISPKKKALAITANGSFLLKRWALQMGDIIKINHFSLKVNQLTANSLVLQCDNCSTDEKPLQVTWQNNQLTSSAENNYPNCPNNDLQHKLSRLWLQYTGKTQNLFSLGGAVQCYNRWKLPIPLESAKIIWQDNRYYLLPLRQDIAFSFQHPNSEILGVNQLETAVSPRNAPDKTIKSIIIGYTRYQLTQAGDELILQPKKRIHLFSEAPEDTQYWKQANWTGNISPINTTINTRLILSLALLLLMAYVLAGFLQSAWRNLRIEKPRLRLFASLAISIICFSLAIGVAGENLQTLLIFVMISWFWLTYLLWKNQYLQVTTGWYWFTVLLIAGIGLIVQTQLAAGAISSRWLHFPQGYMQFLLAAAIPFSFIALLPPPALQIMWQWLARGKEITIRWLYGLLLTSLLILLILQFVEGTESGLGFLQPVEFIKLLLVILLAKITLDLNEIRNLNQQLNINWLGRLAKWLLIALVLAVSVTLGVRDFSPLLIIITLLLAYFWIIIRHPVKPRWQSIWKARLVILSALLLIVVAGIYLHESPNSWLAQLLPQTERFYIWANPWNYPDTGKQLQLSLEQVHAGGLFGTNWFGSNGAAMNLPAIQDDFILAFVLFKFGGLFALLLLIAQMIWLGLEFWLVRQLLSLTVNDREQRLSQALLAYILYGLAWMQLLHWLISWGNVLGLLPIMGQPMTWLSSGNSHLIAIALPSVALSLISFALIRRNT